VGAAQPQPSCASSWIHRVTMSEAERSGRHRHNVPPEPSKSALGVEVQAVHCHGPSSAQQLAAERCAQNVSLWLLA
jgi:hypothetical protein